MNYNANTGGRQSLGRKLKRVSDVNAMGYMPYDPQGAAPQQNMYPNLDPNINFQPGFAPVDQPYTTTPKGPGPSPAGPNYNQPQFNTINQMGVVGQNLNVLNQPIVQDMAMQYGQQLASAGTTMLKKEVEKYVPVSKLKYYFAVDINYVASKLLLLFFPFTHKDWSVKYEQDGPVQPRFEINAPDLYIPVMGYVTYVLTAASVLGMQDRFSPEILGILGSSALAWWLVELAVYCGALYLIQVETSLRTLDLLAYSGYKFVAIIFSILVSTVAGSLGYYSCLIYSCMALAFFLLRSLKVQVLAGSSPETNYYGGAQSNTAGHKRRLYFLLFLAAVQPLLSWWLSYHLLPSVKVSVAAQPPT